MIERQDVGVEHPGDGRHIDLEILLEILGLGDVQDVVFGVPRDIAAAPAHRVEPQLFALLGRNVGEEHEERRQADLIERVIPGANGSTALRGLPRGVGDGIAAQSIRFRHPHHVFERAGAPTTRRVDVDGCHAVFAQLDGKPVRVPRGARVAARGVAGPPGHFERTLEPIALPVKDPGQLQQRGITHRVIADAHVPAIVMPVHPEEIVGRTLNRDDGQLAATPALFQGGVHRHRGGLRRHGRDELLAVRLVDGHYRRPRLVIEVVVGGCSPDGRADSPMNVGTAIDVDLRDRAGALEPLHRRRHGVAVGHDDLAGHRGVTLSMLVVEQLTEIAHRRHLEVDGRRRHAAFGCGPGKCRRLRPKLAFADRHHTTPRQRDVELGLQYLERHPEPVQRTADVIRRVQLV